MEDSNCPTKSICLFYGRGSYIKEEINHYNDYCLKGGNNCIIKRNNDLTKKLKDTKDFPKDKKNWRSK